MMTSTTTQEFVITREFKAPRALVFQTWTDMNHLKKWMSPKGTTIEYIKCDIRPGGMTFYKMHSSAGVMYGKAEYKEITPISKLVYMQYFSNEKEEIARHPLSATWPQAMQTTLVFEDTGAQHPCSLSPGLLWVPMPRK
jgi:uncharacterized protein YndB with AHSA1/START domain